MQFEMIRKELRDYRLLKRYLLPDATEEELDELTVYDLIDVINTRIEEGEKVNVESL